MKIAAFDRLQAAGAIGACANDMVGNEDTFIKGACVVHVECSNGVKQDVTVKVATDENNCEYFTSMTANQIDFTSDVGAYSFGFNARLPPAVDAGVVDASASDVAIDADGDAADSSEDVADADGIDER